MREQVLVDSLQLLLDQLRLVKNCIKISLFTVKHMVVKMSSRCEKYHQDYIKTSIQRSLINRHNFTYINFFRFILPVIQKKSPQKILDAGAGGGTLSFYLGSQGYNVIAIEASKIATKIARESLKVLRLEDRVQFLQSRIEEFEYTGYFDLVLCLEVLEHCKDDKKILTKIYSKLRRGGILIVSIPLKDAPLAKLNLLSRFDKEVGHLRRYTKKEVMNKLEKCGFVIRSYVETEGVVRNTLFVFPKFGFIVKFLRGYLVDLFTIVDDFLGKIFGYSDLIVVAVKK